MWTLRQKRLPDGTITKYKGRLVVRGNQQCSQFNKEDTFAPVIDWPTIRLLLNLSLQHELHTVSIDFKNAFVQSDLPEPIYCNMPHGYGAGHEDKVLEVSKSLFGNCRCPKLWYNFLKAKLEKMGFTPDADDPCLFCKNGCIIATYVDDAVICGKTKRDTDAVLEGLKQQALDYDHLGDLSTYLGVQITKLDDGFLELQQPLLTQRVITARGLTDSKPKPTPATRTLGKDPTALPMDENFNFCSVVGMLLYLWNNSRPDCTFAIIQVAQFATNPKASHCEALKRIGHYLQGTQNKGLILQTTKGLNLHCFVDADFAGIWGNENAEDPSSVRLRTGFLITLGGSPVTWSSKFQTDIALSTMEAEDIAASTSMHTLIPLLRQLAKISKFLSLSPSGPAQISILWEDNQAALQLATKNPPWMTPRSKYIGIKYHWFRSHLQKGEIEMHHIGTDNQLADMFTKPLGRQLFTSARLKVLGW